jgi:4-alpha-glucanotransferase
MRKTGDAETAADWRRWPESLRSVNGSAVHTFAAQNERDVDFHRFLQFELDRQLGNVQRVARTSGMSIGVYQDLALGSSAAGFDAWAYRDLFVQSVSVGAPPDAFAQEGQTWGCPPISPLALRENRYEYWIRLLRTAFEHCGMLRIDHVMGMWRQFWVPDGMPAREGAYMQYPVDDLLGILALESVRAGAIVVGEEGALLRAQ